MYVFRLQSILRTACLGELSLQGCKTACLQLLLLGSYYSMAVRDSRPQMSLGLLFTTGARTPSTVPFRTEQPTPRCLVKTTI